METLGQYYNANHKKLNAVNDDTLKVAISKCKEHVNHRLYQRMLYGAHTSTNLGEDPVKFYTEDAIDAVISGRWEWKDKYNLAEQLIRIADSKISKEVEKSKTDKAQSLSIEYFDPESELYKFELSDDNEDTAIKLRLEKEVKIIEDAIKGDSDLEFLFECIKEGQKRRQIAALMDITPKRYDKLIEQLKEKVVNCNSFKNPKI
jgi:hypothetical protein